MTDQGFYSILRWRTDATRDEARNVAVLLVDRDGRLGGMRAAPISSISPRLHEQGLLDAILVNLEATFQGSSRPTLETLEQLRAHLQRSLVLTEPRLVAVPDVDVTLDALYRAYAAPKGGGSTAATHGRVLDRVMTQLRRRGWSVKRGEYVGDFIFDLVVSKPKSLVGEVFSFASGAKNLVPVEQSAGHFLYGLKEVDLPGLAVIEPPADPASNPSFERVTRWLNREGVEIMKSEELAAERPQQLALNQ
jgi:hypothetical protein